MSTFLKLSFLFFSSPLYFILASISGFDAAVKGDSPKSIWQKMMPTDQMSAYNNGSDTFNPYFWRDNSSGAIVDSVPRKV